jgi:hypothetical protein
MGILNYFKPVSVMTAEEVREFLKKRNPGYQCTGEISVVEGTLQFMVFYIS